MLKRAKSSPWFKKFERFRWELLADKADFFCIPENKTTGF